MNTKASVLAKFDALADQALAHGFQVRFSTETVTEGSRAGSTLRQITISAYDEGSVL